MSISRTIVTTCENAQCLLMLLDRTVISRRISTRRLPTTSAISCFARPPTMACGKEGDINHNC